MRGLVRNQRDWGRDYPSGFALLSHLPYEGEAQQLRPPFIGELSPKGD